MTAWLHLYSSKLILTIDDGVNQMLTRQERAKFVEQGIVHYNSLRPKLERDHMGKYVAISVKTGQYIPTEDDEKLKAFAASLEKDDFLWMTRVGESLA